MPRRLAPFAVSCALALIACLAAPVLPEALAVDLDAAKADLEQLKKSMKPKATNEDLIQYMEAVATAFKDLDKPTDPGPEASEDDRKAFEAAMAKFEKEQEKFRDDAVKQILKVLTLYKVKDETNIRDDVNARAARVLGDFAPFLTEDQRSDLSRELMQAIDKKMTKVKTHTINTDHLEATFEALGKLNDPAALLWMNAGYTHANENEKEYLIAAHKAMVLFKKVDGKDRFEIVSQFVKMYSGIELQAEQTTNDPKVQQKKRFWDEIKIHTIPVVQYFADQPKDAEGANLAEMKQFQEWLREHKNTRKEPWSNEWGTEEEPKK